MKQSSDIPYIHPNPIFGAFIKTDSEKRDIKIGHLLDFAM
jgi:hypothetical protein